MDLLDFLFKGVAPTPMLVCAIGDDGGDHGGGSGGGSSQGQGQGAGSPDDSTTDPGQGNTGTGTVDIQELVTSTVNRAVSSQLNRRLPQAIAEGLSSVLEQARPPQSEGADPPPTGASADPATTEDSEVRRLRTELDAIKKQAAAERDVQEKERKQRDEEALTGNLNTLLTKHGVEPLRIRGALSVVRSAVKRDQDGQAVYQVQRDGYTEDLPLEQGVKEWLTTDEGKAYLSPQQTTGSGTRPSGQQAVIRRKPANKAQQKREAAERLTQQLRSLLASSEVDLE